MNAPLPAPKLRILTALPTRTGSIACGSCGETHRVDTDHARGCVTSIADVEDCAATYAGYRCNACGADMDIDDITAAYDDAARGVEGHGDYVVHADGEIG